MNFKTIKLAYKKEFTKELKGFLVWLNTKYHKGGLKQSLNSTELADPFGMTDKEFKEYWVEYLNETYNWLVN